MNEPRWLSVTSVLAMHEEVVQRHGGAAGVRDAGLLESALARPQHRHAYGEADLFALAASYAAGVAWNHPFVDGNKRTAFVAAGAFLFDNGWDLDAEAAEAVVMMVALAEKGVDEAGFAAWLREHSRPLAGDVEQSIAGGHRAEAKAAAGEAPAASAGGRPPRRQAKANKAAKTKVAKGKAATGTAKPSRGKPVKRKPAQPKRRRRR